MQGSSQLFAANERRCAHKISTEKSIKISAIFLSTIILNCKITGLDEGSDTLICTDLLRRWVVLIVLSLGLRFKSLAKTGKAKNKLKSRCLMRGP